MKPNAYLICRTCRKLFQVKDMKCIKKDIVRCPKCNATENIYIARDYEIEIGNEDPLGEIDIKKLVKEENKNGNN